MTRSDISRSGTAAVPERHEVAIVLSPGFSHLSLPAVTEPLFIANWLLGEQTFARWQAEGSVELPGPDGTPTAVSFQPPPSGGRRMVL